MGTDAVALVRAYLHVNGDSTVTEYPVLEAALVRFGCCDPGEVAAVVEGVIDRKESVTEHGHRIRMLAFGSTVPEGDSLGHAAISLGNVVSFLRGHLKEHWDVVRSAQVSDPALGFLSLLERADRGKKR